MHAQLSICHQCNAPTHEGDGVWDAGQLFCFACWDQLTDEAIDRAIEESDDAD